MVLILRKCLRSLYHKETQALQVRQVHPDLLGQLDLLVQRVRPDLLVLQALLGQQGLQVLLVLLVLQVLLALLRDSVRLLLVQVR